MCSRSQLQDSDRSNSHFEYDKNGGKFEKLAVKRYVRSGAGNVMDDPEDIRPPQVLWLTVRYLRDCVIDQDRCPAGASNYMYEGQRYKPNDDYSQAVVKFSDIYSFVKDRTRQISQDLSFYKNLIQSQESIWCLENMIRILVVAFHDGMKVENFDSHTNLKQLTGFIGDLKDQYHQLKLKKVQFKTCESEILCYEIICTAMSTAELTALLMGKKVDAQVREAIQIASAIQLNDFGRFFQLLKKTNYMFACLMTHFMMDMREVAVRMLKRSFARPIDG